jgi:hypothetical protein
MIEEGHSHGEIPHRYRGRFSGLERIETRRHERIEMPPSFLSIVKPDVAKKPVFENALVQPNRLIPKEPQGFAPIVAFARGISGTRR